METDEILNRIEQKERKAKKRAILLTFIPLISAIILIAYTSKVVFQSEKKLAEIKIDLQKTNDANKLIKSQNDSLSEILQESTINLGKAMSVLSETKNFIDKMSPPVRSSEEAKYYVEFRMLEERIRGDYLSLSDKVSRLPIITEDKNWIVILASSVSLNDLKKEAERFRKILVNEELAIYKTKVYYALVAKGNGTFTRAYRLNVDLIDNYGINSAYFSGSKDWGTDYLKGSE